MTRGTLGTIVVRRTQTATVIRATGLAAEQIFDAVVSHTAGRLTRVSPLVPYSLPTRSGRQSFQAFLAEVEHLLVLEHHFTEAQAAAAIVRDAEWLAEIYDENGQPTAVARDVATYRGRPET